jgi:hypothetical protein
LLLRKINLINCGNVTLTNKKANVVRLKAVETLGSFILDILVATLLFLVIAAVAVGLSLVVKKLIGIGIDPLITNGLTIIEHVLFIVDSTLFLLYFARNSIELAKEILKK